MTKYVLSIDGGGVRGLASATFLSELDKSTNKKPVSYTHLRAHET